MYGRCLSDILSFRPLKRKVTLLTFLFQYKKQEVSCHPRSREYAQSDHGSNRAPQSRAIPPLEMRHRAKRMGGLTGDEGRASGRDSILGTVPLGTDFGECGCVGMKNAMASRYLEVSNVVSGRLKSTAPSCHVRDGADRVDCLFVARLLGDLPRIHISLMRNSVSSSIISSMMSANLGSNWVPLPCTIWSRTRS